MEKQEIYTRTFRHSPSLIIFVHLHLEPTCILHMFSNHGKFPARDIEVINTSTTSRFPLSDTLLQVASGGDGYLHTVALRILSPGADSDSSCCPSGGCIF